MRLYFIRTYPSKSCHISDEEGCYMEGKPNEILNPIRSGKVKTHESFRIKYGKFEVKAKTPRGEFLWPGKCTIVE